MCSRSFQVRTLFCKQGCPHLNRFDLAVTDYQNIYMHLCTTLWGFFCICISTALAMDD